MIGLEVMAILNGFCLLVVNSTGGQLSTGMPSLFLADPGQVSGCSTNSVVINSFFDLVILPLPWLYGAAKPNNSEIVLPV